MAVWELGTKKGVAMFIITILSALLLDIDFSLDFFLSQLSFCRLSEITHQER